MSWTNKYKQTGGGALLVLGLVFTVIGFSGQQTFLWIGIPFLVSGICGWVCCRRQPTSDEASRQEDDSEPSRDDV